jgi:hypothetical protein
MSEACKVVVGLDDARRRRGARRWGQSDAGGALSGRVRGSIIRRIAVLLAAVAIPEAALAQDAHDGPGWLAGDHHVHSRFSVGWDKRTDPPSPILGADAAYPIPMNALMARRYGLSWMVATDHGGPNHSKVALEHAYPELIAARQAVPE